MTRFDVIGSIELAGPTGLTSAMVVGFRRTEAQLMLASSPGDEGDVGRALLSPSSRRSASTRRTRWSASRCLRASRASSRRPEGVKLKVAIDRELPARSQRVLDEALRLLLGSAEQGSGKRKHPRIEGQLQLRCESAHPNASLKDLSYGGLGMFATQPLALGRTVTVALLDREGEEFLSVRAHVRHQRTALARGAARLRGGARVPPPHPGAALHGGGPAAPPGPQLTWAAVSGRMRGTLPTGKEARPGAVTRGMLLRRPLRNSGKGTDDNRADAQLVRTQRP